jgi:hypothetical protein
MRVVVENGTPQVPWDYDSRAEVAKEDYDAALDIAWDYLDSNGIKGNGTLTLEYDAEMVDGIWRGGWNVVKWEEQK